MPVVRQLMSMTIVLYEHANIEHHANQSSKHDNIV